MDIVASPYGSAGSRLNHDLFASFDIGSNKVRLQIDRVSASGYLTPVFERDQTCMLARGLTMHGTEATIDRASLQLALHNLREFRSNLRDYAVPERNVTAVMTEAIRIVADSQQGQADIAALRNAVELDEQRCPVINGEEEARLDGIAAMMEKIRHSRFSGDVVISAIGGGSMELCVLRDNNSIGFPMALRLGMFPLRERSSDNPIAAMSLAAKELAVSRFPAAAAPTVVFMGGNCRALRAPICGDDQFALSGGEQIRKVLANVGELQVQDFRKAGGKIAKRADALPVAVAAMRAVVEHARAEQIVFVSATMREAMNYLRAGTVRGTMRVPPGLERLFVPAVR